MYEQNYIVLNGEFLGKSVVANRCFDEIYNISKEIARNFIKVVDNADFLEKPVRIKHFIVENGNCINIDFKTKTSSGNAIFAYILDKYNNLVLDGYLLIITAGKNYGSSICGKNFDNNEKCTKIVKTSNDNKFSNLLKEYLKESSKEFITEGELSSFDTIEADGSSFDENKIDNDFLYDNSSQQTQDNKSFAAEELNASSELETIEEFCINEESQNALNLKAEDKLNSSEGCVDYINKSSADSLISEFETASTNENNDITNQELKNDSNKIEVFDEEFVHENNLTECDNLSEKEETNNNCDISPSNEKNESEPILDISLSELDKCNLTDPPEEINNSSAIEELSNLTEEFDNNYEEVSSNKTNEVEDEGLNEIILESTSDDSKQQELDLSNYYFENELFEKQDSEIIDFFDTIPRFKADEEDYDILYESPICESQQEHNEDTAQPHKFCVTNHELDRETKMTMYKDNFVGYDKHMAALKIDKLKQKIKALQKDENVTNDDVLDAQIELLLNDKAKAFRILDSNNKNDVLQIDGDLFLSKDKIYRWGDMLILEE